MRCVNADIGVLYKLSYIIKLSKCCGGCSKPLMDEDFQFPPHYFSSSFSNYTMQGGASNLCGFYDLKSVDRKTLTMDSDDLCAKIDQIQRALAMRVSPTRGISYGALDANSRITDGNAEITLPIPVNRLPEGFPAHNTLAKLEGLSNALLKQILGAHNVPFQDNALKAVLITEFLLNCNARNLVDQVAQNFRKLSKN